MTSFSVSLPSSLPVSQPEKMFCSLHSADVAVGAAVEPQVFVTWEAAVTGKLHHGHSLPGLRAVLAKGQPGCSLEL